MWAGGTARQLGLVDRFGSLDDAIAEAARRANLNPEEASVTWLETEPGFWAAIASGMSSEQAHARRDVFTRLSPRPEELLRRVSREVAAIAEGPAIQARCLECPVSAPLPAGRVEQGWLTRMLALLTA